MSRPGTPTAVSPPSPLSLGVLRARDVPKEAAAATILRADSNDAARGGNMPAAVPVSFVANFVANPATDPAVPATPASTVARPGTPQRAPASVMLQLPPPPQGIGSRGGGIGRGIGSSRLVSSTTTLQSSTPGPTMIVPAARSPAPRPLSVPPPQLISKAAYKQLISAGQQQPTLPAVPPAAKLPAGARAQAVALTASAAALAFGEGADYDDTSFAASMLDSSGGSGRTNIKIIPPRPGTAGGGGSSAPARAAVLEERPHTASGRLMKFFG